MGPVACYEVQYGLPCGLCVGSQAQHVRGICSESWGNAGRCWGVMCCFFLRHFAPWGMISVGVRLASFGANSRVCGRTLPVTGDTGCCFKPVGV